MVDHLGKTQFATDDTGTVVWDGGIVTPFGESIALANSFAQNLMFPGQYRDDESGLSHNWHRTYDPTLGRYLQSDPIGLAGGINRYAYVGGNPLSMVDPKGLDGWLMIYSKYKSGDETFGHSFIRFVNANPLPENQSCSDCKYSFWGTNGDGISSPKSGFNFNSPFDNAENPEYQVRVQYLNDEEERQLYKRLEKYKDKRYRPFTFNCTTFATEVWNSFGQDPFFPNIYMFGPQAPSTLTRQINDRN